MRVINTIQEMEQEYARWSGQIGFVPTMGALHEGHLSLFRRARLENQVLVGSIFVNPLQFGPHEDLNRYPRKLQHDLSMLEDIGVDAVFTPTSESMYPRGFTTYVEPQGPLANEAEGASRPGHFRGVATVVLKLFQLVRPHRAYFGQKDAQQVLVISHMIADFHLPIQLRVLPTIREADGLAMSSRNTYLDPASRAAATVLYRALQAGRETFDARPQDGPQAVARVMREVIASESLIRLDYAEVRDAEDFHLLEQFQAPALLVIAAHVGSTRLIDNFALHADGTWDTGLLVSEPAGTPDKAQ
jgi:pantoate--beta-alanine ligase